jgi:hypothetical protein
MASGKRMGNESVWLLAISQLLSVVGFAHRQLLAVDRLLD